MSLPVNYTVFVNGNAEILKIVPTVADFMKCFHRYLVLPSIQFGITSVLVGKNRNISEISFEHQNHAYIWI